MFETLFSKVAFQLTLAMVCGGAGAALGRNLRSLGAFIVLIIAAFAGIYITDLAFAGHVVAGTICLAAWTAVIGALSGPAVQMYSEKMGWETVTGAFLATGGVMAGCGMVATFSGINFGAIGGILTIALYGLIIFGVIGIFVKMGRQARILESIIGMIVFAGYFLFDFWRLSNATENTWRAASRLTMNLYLDFWNFVMYLLQFLAETQDKSHSMIDQATHPVVALLGMMPGMIHDVAMSGQTLVSCFLS